MARTFTVGEHAYRMPLAPETPLAERPARLYWTRTDVMPFVPRGVSDGERAYAIVDGGRWIVRCPFCPSAQIACETDRRFFCVECLNEPVGRRWLRVVWPDQGKRAQIEAELWLRERPDKMSWEHTETVEDLAKKRHESAPERAQSVRRPPAREPGV